MLVATANWGLGDGRLAAAPDPSLPGRLSAEVHRAAWRAGFRHDGRYRPLERLVLVLAGDTFDTLVSDRWLDGVRPWERGRAAAARREDVLAAAWRAGRRHLAWVVRLARRGLVVPAADRRGRPLPAASVRVPTHVVVLTGDRDAALAACGPALADRGGIGVGSGWEADGVRVTHGAAFDPLGADDRDGAPTLLQSLAVDLMARFGAALRTRSGTAASGRRLMRLLADAAPLDAPQRLAAVLAGWPPGESQAVLSAWRASVERWGREARRLGCAEEPGVVDAIAGWLHAVAVAPPVSPPVRRVIEALVTPLPARSAAGMLVVGHPGPSTAIAGERVVCLGPPPLATRRPTPCGPVRGRLGDCFETGAAALPGRLSAVAVLDADEGSAGVQEWWPLADDRQAVDAPAVRGRTLEAA